MKPITPQQIASLSTAQQYFHDCYIVSSLGILSRSKKGKKILQNNITTNGKDFNIKFNNVNEKVEDYFISEKEINNLKFKSYENEMPFEEKLLTYIENIKRKQKRKGLKQLSGCTKKLKQITSQNTSQQN